tara:strand:+ start:129 stop:569 length:441 start_codon:yes stop_codon:yes gene_type:complete
MKLKSLSKLIISMVVLSTMYAGTVAPTLTSRFNDILGANNALPAPSVVLGLEAEVSEGVYVGLDTDGLQNRMYVQLGFGTFGMGTIENAGGDVYPQFSIGGSFTAFDRFSVNLEYLLNQLTDADGSVGANTDPSEDQLRIGLTVKF